MTKKKSRKISGQLPDRQLISSNQRIREFQQKLATILHETLADMKNSTKNTKKSGEANANND